MDDDGWMRDKKIHFLSTLDVDAMMQKMVEDMLTTMNEKKRKQKSSQVMSEV